MTVCPPPASPRQMTVSIQLVKTCFCNNLSFVIQWKLEKILHFLLYNGGKVPPLTVKSVTISPNMTEDIKDTNPSQDEYEVKIGY